MDNPNDPEVFEVPIADAIDLHSFPPQDTLAVVKSYLEAAHERGFREVRLIHGKGKGIQRRNIQELLGHHPLVDSFSRDPATWGATVVTLKD